jgi:hypothetical protein
MSRLQELEKLMNDARNIRKEFDNCQQFKESKKILEDAKRAIEFYEGRQWGEYKGKISIDKPVMNFIQNTTDGKASSILQKTYKPIFIIDEDKAKSDSVTKFSEWQMKEMNQEELNKRMVYDGLIKGTYIVYYYWEEDGVGRVGATEGSLNATTIDIQDFAVANPCEKNEQKQEWIIIRSRESIKSIKASTNTLDETEADKYIKPNTYTSYYNNDIEQGGEEMATVYTKFFRQDGEVYFEKSTEEIVFWSPTSINPLTNAEIVKSKMKESETGNSYNLEETKDMYKQDPVNRQMMDSVKNNELTLQEQMKKKFMARYYPVHVDCFIERNNCIFGMSFTAQLIPIQKSVNQLITTQLISAAKQSMPTIVVKEGALASSTIDMTKPGGVITDRYQGGDGIKVLNTGSMPTAHYELAQSLITLTKDVWRASDVLDDGRNIPSGMSGYAINQLLQIQDKPIAQWQQVLSRTIAKEGRILEMFYKLYYRDTTFSSQMSDAELLAQNPSVDLGTISHSKTDIFNGADYLDTPFNVTIEVCESAKYSEVMLSTTLETLFLNGTIEKISPEYLMIWAELVPDWVFPKKDEFRTLLKQKMDGIISQLTAQNQQLQAMLQQSASMQTAMKQEFSKKIEAQNAQLKQAENLVRMAGQSEDRRLQASKEKSAAASQTRNVS